MTLKLVKYLIRYFRYILRFRSFLGTGACYECYSTDSMAILSDFLILNKHVRIQRLVSSLLKKHSQVCQKQDEVQKGKARSDTIAEKTGQGRRTEVERR